MPEFRELLDGYARFRRQDFQRHRDAWSNLAKGQNPPVMIIGCCDSRVDPATVFDMEPGQAFVLRNVANLVPAYGDGAGLAGVRSAIEFAVLGLEVKHIVVMGHESCGGVAASISGADLGQPGPSFLDEWIAQLEPSRDTVLEDAGIDNKQLGLELESIRQSIANLMSFPYVAERVASGKLKLHGCHFSIGQARLSVLDPDSGRFDEA